MQLATNGRLVWALLLAAAVLPQAGFGQTGWEVIDTKVTAIASARPTYSFSSTDWIYVDDQGRNLYVTTDAGDTWEQRSIDRGSDVLSGMHFFDLNRGVAFRGNNDRIQAMWTEDGGQSWTHMDGQFPRLGVRFRTSILNTTTLFASSVENVYRTDDAGATWTAVPGSDGAVGTFVALDSDTYLMAVDQGFSSRQELRKSTDQGATWETLHTFDRVVLDLHALSREHLVLQTDRATWFSGDGGETWAPSDVPESVNIHVDREAAPNSFGTISIVNSQTAFIGGRTSRNHGYLLRTDDGGASFTEVQLPQEVLFDGYIDHITHVPGDFIVVVTSRGMAARSDLDATNTAVEEGSFAPEHFTLSPAYPNPFNPQTQFDLTVHQPQHVRVVAHDVLGREVRLLFSGLMQSGQRQTIRFAAGSLPSGSYLISVQGEHFTATRSVLLLK